MVVISDTSPISGLYRIGYLHLLHTLYGQVVVPAVVMQELFQLNNFGYDLVEITQADWIVTNHPKNMEKVGQLLLEIDAGEAHAIVLAQEMKADLLLIDEARGRRIAKSEGITISGLLGVLLEAKALGQISAVKPLLMLLMDRANFRLDQKLINEVLQLAKE